MAIINDNELETIEIGSTSWRIICNNNFSKTITEKKLENGVDTDVKVNGKLKTTSKATLDSLEVSGETKLKDDTEIQGALAISDKATLNSLEVSGETKLKDEVSSDKDITFGDANTGVVLIDRSNTDDLYRLYVDNGNLKVEKLESDDDDDDS